MNRTAELMDRFAPALKEKLAAAERMLPAHITRLMTFAQHGQPSGYAASDMMRADLESVIRAACTPDRDRPAGGANSAFALEDLRQIEHALWVLLEHNTLHLGDKHSTVVAAQRAHHTVLALLSAGENQEPANATERQHHAALQRIGYALGLPPGADLHQQCVPAIEAFQRATHCNVCRGLLRAGNFHELCGAGMTTMCNCPAPPTGAQPTEDAMEFALMRFAGLDKDNANHRAIAKQVLAKVVAPQEDVVNAPSDESAADEALWAILVGRAERYFSRDTGESDFDFLQRAISSKPQKEQA